MMMRPPVAAHPFGLPRSVSGSATKTTRRPGRKLHLSRHIDHVEIIFAVQCHLNEVW
jgi:hypothetical protein